MDNKAVLDELLELLEKNNVKIRKDSLGGGGSGLCKIKGEYLFFLDMDSSSYEVAISCAKAVNEIIDIETIYLKPEVREFLEGNK
ncbi:MAG: hypothetical protein ABR969_01370 [Sedimentisphaerales bacterium]|jgi:hypothetical protein